MKKIVREEEGGVMQYIALVQIASTKLREVSSTFTRFVSRIKSSKNP